MKRLICGFLTVLMLVSMLAAGAVGVSAASSLTTSEKAIKLLKDMEGFAKKPFWDNRQYTVGYGSACNPSDYPNGITTEQADALLRKALTGMEAAVNKFADRYNLKLSQRQFDALMLFTYNCGVSWTNADSDLRTSIINGDSGNDFIYYMTRWCTVGGEVSLGLVDRRLAEADLYLYGYYNLHAPGNYGYVLFDANEGTCESRIQGFDASEPVKVRVTPVYTGYRFLGWYTAKEGGKWITDLDSTTMDITLYARWQKGEGNVDANGKILGISAKYQRIAGAALTVYEVPSADAKTLKQLDKGANITVTADYVDSKGVKWGKLDQGGWIVLMNTAVATVAAAKPQRPAAEDENGVNVAVTAKNVNVRSGAGTNNPVVGSVSNGQTLVITETKMAGDLKWGKCSMGWICLMYTNYDAVAANSIPSDGEAVATGTVKNCGGLRIRSGAGANFGVVGSLGAGTPVRIMQIKQVAGVEWGQISSGWICLDYVILNSESNDNLPENPSNPDQEEGKQPSEDNSESADTTAKIAGTVISNTSLNIRNGAGTTFDVVGSYARGTQVTILEQKTVGGTPWGRTNKGWISLYYVRLDSEGPSHAGNSSATMRGIIACGSYLNVRDSAGMGGEVVAALAKGDLVWIYETKVVGTTTWGRVDKGWISMNFVKLESGSQQDQNTNQNSQNNNQSNNQNNSQNNSQNNNQNSNQNNNQSNQSNNQNNNQNGNQNTNSGNGAAIATGKVVGANSLRVRSGAGTNYSVVAGLTMGQSVKIYEVKTVSGVVWGRTESGWISMNYVKLDSGSNVVVKVGTVNASSLMIRSAAGSQNAIVGSYARGAKVEIYETTTVAGQPWGRTDKGWICLSYVI